MECLRDSFVEGQVLDGRFVTVSPLNHGSFGMVFLAKDTQTGEHVAIKCLTKASNNTNPQCPVTTVEERSEELECHNRLGFHPNIVNLVHSFETEAHFYLVLEYCSMGDLYEAIRLDRGPLETEHVRDFMLQLVSAVDFMHSKGLYHRDIKPENIFLTHQGSMKLGDFGLATCRPWSYESCVGSDRYMAPEQYEPTASGYSPSQADIWSIGICLLNILFARNPFVTPTESDILFADYTRDRQSLFDIFPNMSQDTFEILIHAMAIDPEKRSLSQVREAILRAVCFTTDDETLDDFCTEDRDIVPASADREPLRTPSIQSPQINQGDSFPWAKALQASPPVRQLSVIPDTEAYEEDLFPPSEMEGKSWYSTVQPETPSMASVLDSALGASFKSFSLRQPEPRFPPASDPVPITGSLPSHAARPIPAMSMVFGRGKHEPVSKSWSDLWDEEESENEDMTLQLRREQNSRSWSQESLEEQPIERSTGLSEPPTSSFVNARSQSPKRDRETVHEPASPKAEALVDSENDGPMSPAKRSPNSRQSPRKSSDMDKWAALGNKRRNYQPKESDVSAVKKKQSMTMNWRRDWGLGSSGFDYGTLVKKDLPPGGDRRRPYLAKAWRRDPHETIRSNDTKYPLGGSDGADDDFEWVGGWHELHL